MLGIIRQPVFVVAVIAAIIAVAWALAKGVIRKLKETRAYDDPAWHMVVKDENGDIVFSIPFQNPDLV
jgi:hypothetical protein